VHSSSATKHSSDTCNGAGLSFVHIFLFFVVIIGGCYLLGGVCTRIAELCEGDHIHAQLQYGRVRNNDAVNGNAENVEMHNVEDA
jgi:hypothetical protein